MKQYAALSVDHLNTSGYLHVMCGEPRGGYVDLATLQKEGWSVIDTEIATAMPQCAHSSGMTKFTFLLERDAQ